MAINYGSLLGGATVDTVVDPQQLFQALPSKQKKYSYLRDVQGDVLSKWHLSPSLKDVVLKMNTGGGKTTVGLLIAKSSINDGVGPAIYLCPDNYLVAQTVREAMGLGLRFADDPRSPDFHAGQSILICTAQTLFNGLSKFGVGRYPDIDVGTIVVDDAHACLSVIEEQFSLRFERDADVYKNILAIFEEDLKSQSISSVFDLKSGDPRGFMQVPFWSWYNRKNEILKIIEAGLDDSQRKFVWPLVRETFQLLRCFISTGRIEISGRCLPADVIPSFAKAKRRVYMTATLSDDSILVTAFGADRVQVASPITPKTASDIGERMILAPQQINIGVSDESIRSFVAEYAKTENVVVIVPSSKRAEFWKPVASDGMILTAANLEEGVSKLRASKGYLAVLVNKYDGIDLPDDACRILVVDGIPDAHRLIDKYEQGTLASSARLRRKQMQRIEQGMGRGIRSNEDYCVVILMGAQLLKVLYAAAAMKYLSPATRKQLELSRQLADHVKHKGLEALREPIQDVLGRNSGWVSASKNNLINVTYPPVVLDEASVAQRSAFDARRINQNETAFAALQKCADASDDDYVAGWLLDQAAEALHPIDRVKSQTVLVGAIRRNHTVTKPIEGITYQKLVEANDQAKEASHLLSKIYVDGGNNVVIGVNGLLDSLSFKPEGSEEFEQALMELGLHLGFKAHRPEKEGGGKLDVLWALGKYRFMMFACKSEAVAERISKQYADQISGNVNWFADEYGAGLHATPVIAHHASAFDSLATPPVDTRILDSKSLKILKDAVRSFASAVKDRVDDVDFIKSSLAANFLTGEKIVTKFTVAMKKSK